MIKIENADIWGWEAAIRGMRNPMNSWSKIDSGMKVTNYHEVEIGYPPEYEFTIGENDLKLMRNLVKAGSDHSKFMRFINITCDVTAPLYWWKEYDTYKVGTVANSCSTMHKIHEKEFAFDDFGYEYLGKEELDILEATIYSLNWNRNKFNETKDKQYWYKMIQMLPTSYNQRRTLQFNYAVLRNMYHARKEHKLDEWRDFCKWVETLPYAMELIVYADKQ